MASVVSEIINSNKAAGKKKLLLHSCCGPCSTAVTERLVNDYDVTVFYYNPNINDRAEYEHRKSEQKRFLEESGFSIEFIEGDYDPERFEDLIQGHEGDKEGGARCSICFEMRLRKTAELAKKMGFDAFDTTLTVSPHKNYRIISEIGRSLSEEIGIEYLAGDYKKQNGFGRSVELSGEYGLYRQKYCGCSFSDWRKKD